MAKVKKSMEVVILLISILPEQNMTAGNDEFRCMKEIAFYTMTGVVLSIVLFSVYLFLKCKCKFTEKRKYFNRFNLEEIDTCFESKRCEKYSVMNKKIVFYTGFVLLVLIAGFLIGVIEKDLCSGSIVFSFLGIVLSLTLFILFIRIKGVNEEPQDSQVNEVGINLVEGDLNGVADERAND